MKYRNGRICTLILCAAGLLVAADDPFIGKWKLNQSMSDFTGGTFKFEDAGNGMIRFTGGTVSYNFATDGKERPTVYGRSMSVKSPDPKTWERTVRYKGKVVDTATQKLSDDGKTMTETDKGIRPDGSTAEETDVYERVGEGSGFMGTWKTKEVKGGGDETMDIAANGADGWTMNIPEFKGKCVLKLDGKDYPATGPQAPAGLTLSATKSGDRSIDLTEKIKGKPTFKMTWMISDDGKTLTSTGSVPGRNEPTKAVYDKQ